MNGVPTVDIGREKDFMFGSALVRPASRLFIANGTEEVLEPRVMQVLVLLTRHCGEVVSRDDLVAKCWSGRVVGEDAINRPISIVRKLGESSGAFSIETITRVGYRLTAKEAASTIQETIAKAPTTDGAVVATAATETTHDRRWMSRWPVPLSPLAVCIVLAIVVAAALLLSGRDSSTTGQASVAVLPFADRNGDQAHLSAGISDELLSRLRLVDGLAVAGGAWMPRLLQEVGDPKNLGERLSVNHLLEGSVQRDGDRLRITARLVAANDGHIVWSQDFDHKVSDVFAIQDEIARSVANAMSVVLDVGLQSTNYGGTRSFEAYDRYLRGLALRNIGSPDRPVEELQAAVSIDPNYARAWAELAIAWGTVARQAVTPEKLNSGLSKMDEASAKAASLAPNMWFGHTPRGWYYVGRNDWVNADAAIRRALALGDIPDPELHFMVQAFATQVGRASEMQREIERILAIDARYGGRDQLLLQSSIPMRDYAAGWRAYAASHDHEPDYNALRESLAMWLAFAEGNEPRARELLRTLAAKPGGIYVEMEKLYDDKTERLAALRRIAEAPNQQRGQLSYLALFAGQYGEPELAVQLLRRAYLGPGWAGQFPIWYPQLAEARKMTAFKDFVRELGFVEMWRTSGDWGDFCRPVGESDFECT